VAQQRVDVAMDALQRTYDAVRPKSKGRR